MCSSLQPLPDRSIVPPSGWGAWSRSRIIECSNSISGNEISHPLGTIMCDRCRAIDRDIANYRRAYASNDDDFVLSLFAEAIEDLQAEKAALHPKNEERA